MGRTSLYEATPYTWVIDPDRAARAEIIVAVRFGLIIAAFVAERCLPATVENFPGREPNPKRYGFEGTEASEELKRLYVGKRLPDDFRKRGASNPIKYTYR